MLLFSRMNTSATQWFNQNVARRKKQQKWTKSQLNLTEKDNIPNSRKNKQKGEYDFKQYTEKQNKANYLMGTATCYRADRNI